MRHICLAVFAVVLSLGASVSRGSRVDQGRLVADSDIVDLGGLYVPVGAVPKWCDVKFPSSEPSEDPILVGRLRKRVGGRVVNEVDLKFRYIIVD